MGRGRAKAKQTKVARELKYHSPNTDLAALQRELGGCGKSEHRLRRRPTRVRRRRTRIDDADDDQDDWAPPTR